MNYELMVDRDQAETVACPARPRGCGAAPGEPCINLQTGRPLEHLPAHDARLRAAGVLHAPLDPRQLAARNERTPR